MLKPRLRAVWCVCVCVGIHAGAARSQDPVGPARKDAPKLPQKIGDSSKGSEASASAQPNGDAGWVWQSNAGRLNNEMQLLRGLVGAEGAGPIIRNGQVTKYPPPRPDETVIQRFLFLIPQSDALRNELKMTPKQEASLKKIQLDRQKKRAAAEARRDAIEASDEFKDPKKVDEIRKQMFDERSKALSAANDDFVESISELLTIKQFDRLDQIALQIRGPLAVADAKVAALIGLTEEQFADVRLILEELTTTQKGVMDAAFGRTPDAEGVLKYKPLPQEKKVASTTEPGKKASETPKRESTAASTLAATRDQRNAETATRLDWATTRLETARDEAVARIGKCLSRQQKVAFNQRLGRRIKDLTELVPDNLLSATPPKVPAPQASPKASARQKK
jgi:hypothetical protein